MTRVLSELLGVSHLELRSQLDALERASGHPSHDVRLSAEVRQKAIGKVRELGLDPSDTTSQELYLTLRSRIAADEQRIQQVLQEKVGGVSMQHVARIVSALPIDMNSFSIKAPVVKKMLQKSPPKRVMKQLGYRSLDSLLKHENTLGLFTLAWAVEAETWRRAILTQYKKLGSRDFEMRKLSVLAPSSERWQKAAETFVSEKRHTVLDIKELGVVMLLPLPKAYPKGALLASILLTLKAINEVKSSSTFLKLSQVKPHFGLLVHSVALGEPLLRASTLDQSVAWQTIQRFYSQYKHEFRAELFEPHIELEDLSWHSVESLVLHIDQGLEFWNGTHFLSHHKDGQIVSFNILDVVLGYCNTVPFEYQLRHYFRASLISEITMRYLRPQHIEEALTGHMQLALEPQLA